MSSYKLRSTSLKIINVPSQIIKEIGWDINDELDIIISGLYDNNGNFSHNTLSIEKVEDYEKYAKENK